MYLVFDTETTGLPRKHKAPVSDVENWPRMVQLAWQQYDFAGTLIGEGNAIIRPEGYSIPWQVARIHGITHARALAEGKDLKEVLTAFSGAVAQAKLVIAHNIDFDLGIVGAEFYRTAVPHGLMEKHRVCTMRSSTAYCKFPGGRYAKYKFPSLTALHQKLFEVAFADAHNALADVRACARCFFELKRLGVIK